jgi:hypothetical protein
MRISAQAEIVALKSSRQFFRDGYYWSIAFPTVSPSSARVHARLLGPSGR